MIRLLRRLGRFPAGTETDFFDAAAEAAFVLDGTAERIDAGAKSPASVLRAPKQAAAKEADPPAEQAPNYSAMKKDELLRMAMARGLDISPRAKVAELIETLEESDANA